MCAFCRFATLENSGLLFYNGRFNEKHDFIALEIQEGQVVLKYSTGTISASLCICMCLLCRSIFLFIRRICSHGKERCGFALKGCLSFLSGSSGEDLDNIRGQPSSKLQIKSNIVLWENCCNSLWCEVFLFHSTPPGSSFYTIFRYMSNNIKYIILKLKYCILLYYILHTEPVPVLSFSFHFYWSYVRNTGCTVQ